MGGCLQPTNNNKKKIKTTVPVLKKSQSVAANRQTIEIQLKHSNIQIQPKYKSMNIFELLTTYTIQETLQLSSKMQGPKYLSNKVDGSSKVLRIVHLADIDEKRLEAYKKVLGFQIYKIDENTLIILDQYCAGQDLHDIIQSKYQRNEEKRQLLYAVFLEIYKVIQEFHKKNIWLGNLNFSSFRRASAFNNKIRLVDFNLTGQTSQLQKVGFAHKESFQADFQFLGYLLSLLVSEQSPIFIPHKIQYVEFNQSVPFFSLIQKLLKGNKLPLSQITVLKPENILIKNKINLGYQFRRDVNKLLKMRKKRKPHDRKLYGQNMKTLIDDHKFQQDAVYRYETERIFARISKYISQIKIAHEQPFLNYSGNNQHLRKFKEVFLFTEQIKKIGQLRECLSTIK